MNPEFPSTPEAHGETSSSNPEADEIIRLTLQRLDSLDIELQVIDSYLRHGPALAAFLVVEDDALSSGDLEARFINAYGGAWENADDLLRHTLDATGWDHELSEFRARQGIPDHYLTWDRGALLEHLRRKYQFVHLDKMLHVFCT